MLKKTAKHPSLLLALIMILLVTLTDNASAFELMNITDNSITVHQAGFFKTEQDISLDQARQQDFHPLPEDAIGVGLDTGYYWFSIDISTDNTSGEKRYIDFKSSILSRVELFSFKGNALIRHQVNGYNTPVEQRQIPITPIRFELENTTETTKYFIKIHANMGSFIAISLGNTETLSHYWNRLFTFTALTVGAVGISLLFVLFLFLSTKDSVYAYYITYIGGLMLLDLAVMGLMPIKDFSGQVIDLYMIVVIFLQLEHIGLVLFTVKFIDIKKTDARIYRYIIYALVADILFAPSLFFGLPILSIVAMTVLTTFLFYAAIKSYINGNNAALFYLIATGVALTMLSIWLMTALGLLIPTTFITTNIAHIALLWDILFLSVALAYRMKQLQNDTLESERMLMLQSRQHQLSEITGNIAHQWRQPLAELGSIMMNLEANIKYAQRKPSNETVLETIAKSTQVIRHLSGTIDTFQGFFYPSKNNDIFSINTMLDDIILFIADSMKHHGIILAYSAIGNASLYGNANAFSQVVLSLLQNAKEALITRQVSSPCITMLLNAEDKKQFILEIRDNGGGIHIKPVDSIFKQYITDKTDGSGIGLYIARKIIEEHFHGSISVKNDLYGAIFEIRVDLNLGKL